MGDSGLTNIINGIFNTITLIDVNNDKVSYLDGNNLLNEVSYDSYQTYFDKIKKVIHPDYLNSYFDAISLNKVKSNQNYSTYKYLKLSSNLNYENYIDIIKLLNDDKILILTIKVDEKINSNSNDSSLSYNYADLIINIEQMIDNIKTRDYETENVIKYIKELLNDSKAKNETVLKSYQDKVVSEVNKTYQTLLIADDDNLTRSIFRKVFESDYNIIEVKNGSEAVEILENNMVKNQKENIVGMFLDLKMPIMDGFGVLDYMNSKHLISRLPVIIISADDAKETKEQVYSYDIADMIEKPFNFEIIKKRVNNMIGMYSKSNILKDLVKNQNIEIKNILKSLKHTYLENHKEVITIMDKCNNILLSKYKENNSNINVDELIDNAHYYDLGLSFVPNNYIYNVNSITIEEKNILMNYPVIGSNLANLIFEDSDNLSNIKNIMLMRNERFDGKGFPKGLKDKEIPDYIYLINISIEMASAIINKKTIDEAIEIIKNKANTKYSLDSIKILMDCERDIKEAIK